MATGGTKSVPVVTYQAKGVGRRTFRLQKRRVIIGAVESADIQIAEKGVAPIHAVFELAAEPEQGMSSVTIFDLAHGVKVNGETVVSRVLQAGDEIELGECQLKFSHEKLQNIPLERLVPDIIRESGGQTLIIDPSEDLSPLLLQQEEEVIEIFDYSPTRRRALEVVMAWDGTIMDVEHFDRGRSVTIGSVKSSDFGVPETIEAKKRNLVEATRGGYFLNLSEEMTGVMQQSGELKKIDSVRKENQTKKGRARVPFGENDFARVEVGDIEFYLNRSPAPPRLKRRKLFERDAFCTRVVWGSIGLTIAIILALLSIQLPETLEVEELPERIATILYQPEKFVPPRVDRSAESEGGKPSKKSSAKTPKVPKVTKLDLTKKKRERRKALTLKGKRGGRSAQKAGKEGEGARQKGKEGRRGTKTSKRAGKPSEKARGSGKSRVEDIGNLDALKGAGKKIEDLLAGISKKGKYNKNLKGFGGFDTQGTGSSLSGDGLGGGGESSIASGLGKKGIGGGRVGTGLGAAGTGEGIVGGKSRIELRTGGAEETIVMGAIDADAVEAAILRHKDEFRLCYEREINAGNPKLSGRVGTNFVIGPRGKVTRAGITKSSLKNRRAERCIVRVLRRINFPKPRGGGIVQVKYAFKFRQTGT